MEEKIIKTRTSKAWVEKENIIHVEVFPKAEITLKDAKEGMEITDKLLGNRESLLLVEMGEIKSISREARQFYTKSSKNDTNNKAVALVITNPVATVIANFFIGLNRPDVPIRLFVDKNKAARWLKKIANDNKE